MHIWWYIMWMKCTPKLYNSAPESTHHFSTVPLTAKWRYIYISLAVPHWAIFEVHVPFVWGTPLENEHGTKKRRFGRRFSFANWWFCKGSVSHSPASNPLKIRSFFQGETWTVKVETLKVVYSKSWGTGNEMTALLFGTMVLMVGWGQSKRNAACWQGSCEVKFQLHDVTPWCWRIWGYLGWLFTNYLDVPGS